MKPEKIDLAFIAKEAGVSRSTVSFFINGKAKQYKISEATCRKIAEVVEKYHFVPNIYARAMQNQKTYLFGFIVPGAINRSYWMDILDGIEEVIAPERYHLVLSVSHFDSETELKSLESMAAKGMDGFFYSPVVAPDGSLPNRRFLQSLQKRSPVILLGSADPEFLSVSNDSYQGGVIAAQTFLEAGHRQFAYLGHYGKKFDLRGAGFVDHLRRNGYDVNCFDTVQECLAKQNQFTALFCFSDYFVLDIYSQCAQAGIQIPSDLSIIGYDDMEFLNLLHPHPVTIKPAKQLLGRLAAKKLLNLTMHPEEAEHSIQLLPELQPGSSIRPISH